jgi:16S rRNA U1498 N3-methylase RsmE
MKEVRYFYVPEAATQVELPAEEATHALRVLRLKGGDEIFLIIGRATLITSLLKGVENFWSTSRGAHIS